MTRRATRSSALLLLAAVSAAPATRPADGFVRGVDLSSLADLERLHAVYRDADGTPGDAIAILHRHGADLVRLRLFVDPSRDFDRTFGATQDLAAVKALSRRAHAVGMRVLLDLHYSDTWADPAHQTKPAAWRDLPFDALVDRVRTYTADVVGQLAKAGDAPEMVQVGNEVTAGLLWPDGKFDGDHPACWHRIGRLLNAGAAGVRSAAPAAKVVVHVSGGGSPGKPPWFFDHLAPEHVDFDVVGLSVYPHWGDGLPDLAKNLAALAKLDKDVIVVETAYPYRPAKPTPQATWPMTPAGQRQFAVDLAKTVRAMPNGRGKGVIWWYPEAEPLPAHRIWEGGGLALFDKDGKVLPAADALGG